MIVVEIGHVDNIYPRAFAKANGFAWPIVELARTIPGLTWEAETKTYTGWPDAVVAFAHALQEENLAVVVGQVNEPSDWLTLKESSERSVGGSSYPSRAAGSGDSLRAYQKEAVEWTKKIAAEGGALLALDVGLGKGQPTSSKVLTPTGWKTIGDLRPGDSVVGGDGKPTSVTDVFPRGEQDVYRLTLDDGCSVVVDGDHLWAVKSNNDQQRGLPYRIMSTADLVRDGLVWGAARQCKWRIPTVGPVEFQSNELTIDPYVLGVLLGDGHLSQDQPSFTVGASKVRVPEEVKRRLPSSVELIRREEQRGEAVAWFFRSTSGPRNQLTGWLRDLGLLGLKSPEKFVPDAYLLTSIGARLDLLRGLMDTDGDSMRADGHVEFTSSSRDLVGAVAFLVRSLGGRVGKLRVKEEPRYTYRGQVRVGLPSYRISIVMPNGVSPFAARECSYADRVKYGVNRIIRSIEPAGRSRTVCISVNAPNGLYVTEDFIVTHNTTVALHAARDMIASKSIPPSVVVVCPAVVKSVWEAEVAKWMPDVFDVRLLSGTKGAQPVEHLNGRPLLAILNYDIAHAWADALPKQIGLLVCDEGHALMDERSRRSRAVKEIASRSEGKVVLSATPMTVRPRDLWNLLDTLEPSRWGKFFKFGLRYCAFEKQTVAKNTTVWITTGASHVEELALRLRWVMYRKSKAEVMSELPARVRQVVPIKVPAKAIAPIWKEGWERSRRDALQRALALSGTGKVGEAVELANARVAEGHSVLVFSYLRETAKRIWQGVSKVKGMKGRVVLATGDDPAQTRAKTIQAARVIAQTQPVVIVATIDAVREGVDLSYCDVVIFVDLDWVPSKLLQAEGRTHRHGQTRSVTVYYLVGIGTADEYVQKKVIERLDLYEKIVGGAEEAKGLRDDLGVFEKMNEDEVIADLRAAVLAGEVLPEEETL